MTTTYLLKVSDNFDDSIGYFLGVEERLQKREQKSMSQNFLLCETVKLFIEGGHTSPSTLNDRKAVVKIGVAVLLTAIFTCWARTGRKATFAILRSLDISDFVCRVLKRRMLLLDSKSTGITGCVLKTYFCVDKHHLHACPTVLMASLLWFLLFFIFWEWQRTPKIPLEPISYSEEWWCRSTSCSLASLQEWRSIHPTHMLL